MLSWSSKTSTSTNAEVGVVILGGTLGEVKVSVIVLGELSKLVDRSLALIPSIMSLNFSKKEPFEPPTIELVAYTT